MSATDSHFAVFRGLVALAWADHELSLEEQQKFQELVQKNISLSAAQKAQAIQEIHTPVKMDAVWPLITDKHDRAHLLNIASLIFQQDGEYCVDEKALYARIYKEHMKTLNQAAVEDDVIALAIEQRHKREAETQERFEDMSVIGKFAYYVEQYLGIELI